MIFRLTPHPRPQAARGPLVLVVLDGVGDGPATEHNAVTLARTPWLDRLRSECPTTQLRAHGTAVGMPSDADMGNSEVGHNALGAGRVFDQGAKLVERSLRTGTLFESDVWRESVSGGTLHFIGLLSDGNVHSHEHHLHAMIREARAAGTRRIRVHALTDGRDVEGRSALRYVERLEAVLAEVGGDCAIASGGGRMRVTMDRYEADWRIVELGWRTHVLGEGRRFPSASAAIRTFYDEDPAVNDQFLPPFVVEPASPMRDGDQVILFNFRGDRAIEITQAFEQETFPHFDRGPRPAVGFAGMMQYDGDLRIPKRYLVAPPQIDGTLSELLAHAGVTQWACSETQKFGHVTYFWNGNRSAMFDPSVEVYRELESDRVPFEQRPWMKAAEITDEVLAELARGRSRFLRVNFANGDMVGHTGHLHAAVVAVEALDLCLGRLIPAIDRAGGTLLVTADHGNCEVMRRRQGDVLAPHTSHTLNPVPMILRGGPAGATLRAGGGLSNVAATVLELLGWAAPPDYDPSLLIIP